MAQPSPAPSTDDLLVRACEPEEWCGARRLLLWAGCAWFALWTAGLGVLDGISPAPIPKVLGEEAAQRAQLRMHASWRDGSAMALADSDLRLRSNLRRWIMPWYAGALLVHLDEGGPDVLVGKDNWLYLTSRLSAGPGPYEPITGSIASGVFATIDRRSSALGLETILIPIPRKGVIAEEFLPDGADPWTGFDEDIFADLEERGIPHIPLLDSLRRISPADSWFPYDSHWSYLAQVQAAEMVGLAMGVTRSAKNRPAKIDPKSEFRRFRGNLNYTGLQERSPASPFYLPRETVRNFELLIPGSKKKWRPKALKSPQEYVLFGTSFSKAGCFVNHLKNVLPMPVHDRTKAATNAIENMSRVLTELQPNQPKTVLLEMPLFQLLPFYEGMHRPIMLPGGTMGGLLKYPAPRVFPLDAPGHLSSGNDRSEVLTIQSGALITSGDGVAELEVRLDASKVRGAKVHGQFGATQVITNVSATWPQGLIPMVGHSHSKDQIRLRLRPDGAGDLGMVTALDLDHAAFPNPGELSVDSANDKAWTVEYTFPEPVQTSRHAALWWQLERTEKSRGQLHIQVVPADGSESAKGGEHVDLGPFRAPKQATILMSLVRPGRWAGIRIEGNGSPPTPQSLPSLVDLPPAGPAPALPPARPTIPREKEDR